MFELSETIKSIKPSPTIAMSALAAELKAEGKDIISLSVGEPDFALPSKFEEFSLQAIREGFNKYTPPAGLPMLREAICEKLKRDNDLSYAIDEIVAAAGGKQALAALCVVLLNKGDEAIVPAPYWTSYPDIVTLAGGTPVVVSTKAEDGYVLDPERLAAAITPKTKILFLNSPSNPTGGVYEEDDLKAVAEVIRQKGQNIVVVTDEVYEYFTYGDVKHTSLLQVAPDLKNQTVVLNALSKSYAMTGWRVGYIAGPKDILKGVSKWISQTTSCVNSLAQVVATNALGDKAEFPKSMVAEFSRRREMVLEEVENIPGMTLPVPPKGAFYAYVRVDELLNGSAVKNSEELAQFLLKEAGVATVQGSAFGDEGALRASFAASYEQVKEAFSRIRESVKRL